jgi:large conductance mechanosensitive channel
MAGSLAVRHWWSRVSRRSILVEGRRHVPGAGAEAGQEVRMRSEFKAFLLKSNALALAIGVVFGAALGTVVNSLFKDILMPPIGYALGGVDFADIKTVLAPPSGVPGTEGYAPEVAILWGVFIQNIIAFIIIALVVFLITKWIVKPTPDAPTKDCPFCKEAVLTEATRCKYCGSEI